MLYKIYIFLPSDYMIIWEQAPDSSLIKKITTIYKRLFTPFVLAKRLRNPIIGGLQGEFGDLYIKYLKQKISKCRSHISGSFRRTPRHCAKWLRNFCSKRTTFSQLKADFIVVHHFAFNLEWSSYNGCNSFISTPNCAPFKALDFWLPDLRNNI